MVSRSPRGQSRAGFIRQALQALFSRLWPALRWVFMPKQASTLFLIGPRGSGKTTVGRLVAETLGLPFYDTDDMVMAEAGMSIADIVEAEGWASFRERESRTLAVLAETVARAAGSALAPSGGSSSGAVVSTGGGMVLDRQNRERMRAAGRVFYLAAPADCLYARLESQNDADRRPSLTGESPLAEIARVLAEREPLYGETAHHRLDASASPDSLARIILGLLTETREESL